MHINTSIKVQVKPNNRIFCKHHYQIQIIDIGSFLVKYLDYMIVSQYPSESILHVRFLTFMSCLFGKSSTFLPLLQYSVPCMYVWCVNSLRNSTWDSYFEMSPCIHVRVGVAVNIWVCWLTKVFSGSCWVSEEDSMAVLNQSQGPSVLLGFVHVCQEGEAKQSNIAT